MGWGIATVKLRIAAKQHWGGRFELFCLTSNKAKQGSKAKGQFALRQTRDCLLPRIRTLLINRSADLDYKAKRHFALRPTRPNKALRKKEHLPYGRQGQTRLYA